MADFKKIADKWQKKWQDSKTFEVKEDSKKKKCYVLEMFPYPSGSGLHMGHASNYTITDVYARYKRMKGLNVLYPVGYDSFGLPAENAAIKAKSHPKIFTENAIKNFIKQQKELGLSYDWSRTIMSHTPEYYHWDQYLFLKFLERGLAYKKKAIVNWCPKCNTVLANEQVIHGKCWRHEDTEVDVKELEQWFLKITDYADELYEDTKKLQWNEDVKAMQENWIGKSKGTEIDFKIENKDKIKIFTTRPDTLYGVTFLVFAPEHPKILELVKGTKYEKPTREFIKKVLTQDRFTRTDKDKEKQGLFIGKYAINPINNEKIPIYIGNFVLLDYGGGAVMSVPAHDQRDFEFAKKYKIPIKTVIKPKNKKLTELKSAYLEEGILINSDKFNNLNNKKAIEEITKHLQKNKLGKSTYEYKLRDWLISRQRFWGCPIPIIYCKKCGMVPEKNLPIKLPEKININTKGNPLESCKEFINTKCPKCKSPAKRETDTMDTFIDSSWYFLRYTDPKNNKQPFDSKKANYWMPIDMYVGGKEHSTGHLIYFRFFTKVLRDLGYLNIDEPAKVLFNQGMLHKEGVVMSKSKGNVVTPEQISKKYGIDTARFYLMFVSSPEKDKEWDDKGIEGSHRSLNKIYNLVKEKPITKTSKPNIDNKMHSTIRDVTENIEKIRFNIALIKIMDYVSYLSNEKEVTKENLEVLIKLISPFTPHLSEELWESLKNKKFISLESWPKFDKKKIDLKIEEQENLIHNTISDINGVLQLVKIKSKKATLFIAPKWKYDLFKKLSKGKKDNKKFIEIAKASCPSKDIPEALRIAQAAMKGNLKLSINLNNEQEYTALKQAIEQLENKFNLKFHIAQAENSHNQKAKNALPGKPAILLE
jgi:leucyl-tRNA synthetase